MPAAPQRERTTAIRGPVLTFSGEPSVEDPAQCMHHEHAFYLATRGAAQALHLEDTIGSIAPGMEADLIVLDLKSTPLIERRMRRCESLDEVLFVQMTLGDERAIKAVYVAGELAWMRGRQDIVMR